MQHCCYGQCHVAGMMRLIKQAVLFAPYSPDLNPTEEAFSKVMKSNEKNWNGFDIETAVSAAFNCITSEDCRT